MADRKKGSAAGKSSKKAKPSNSRQRSLLDHFQLKKPAEMTEKDTTEHIPGSSNPNDTRPTPTPPLEPPLLHPPEEVSSCEESQSVSIPINSETPSRALDQATPSTTPELIDIPLSPELISISSSPSLGLIDVDAMSEVHSPPQSPEIPFLSTNQDNASQQQPSSEGHSRQQPIVIDSSPLKPSIVVRPLASRQVHSFFAPRAKAKPTPALPNGKDGKSSWNAPYPNKDSQHVRGPQTQFMSKSDRHRQKHDATTTDNTWVDTCACLKQNNDGESALHRSNSVKFLPSGTPALVQDYLQTIPEDHEQQHPAIARFADLSSLPSSPTSSSPYTWADKWHPRSACEVLGNEASALYLRDWLRALEIQFESPSAPEPDKKETKSKGSKRKAEAESRPVKRPRIVRAVVKKRGRKKQRVDSDEGEDNWIVATDDEEDIPHDEGDDDELDGLSHFNPYSHEDEPKRLPKLLDAPQHTFDQLHNTILLTGPPGIGKTACVYACAEELGWEVFEVYPGIGKRSGASVDLLIGEVGKNHLVRKTKGRDRGMGAPQSSDAFSRPSTERKQSGEPSRRNGTKEDTVRPDTNSSHPPPTDFGFMSSLEAMSSEPTNDEPPRIRQSVILLEEVDIIFKEDVNFWPAVIKFIKECKRPVICTCNDLSLVPTLDLPLQTVLTFEPCPPPVAASYLQGVCCAQGYLVERGSLLRVYGNLHQLADVDLDNASAEDIPTPDLRKAIHTLQFLCSTTEPSRAGPVPLLELSVDSVEDLTGWTWVKTSADENDLCGARREETAAADDATTKIVTLGGLRAAANHADFISYMDSHLLRSPGNMPTALSFDSDKPSADDEIGHTVVFNSAKRDESQFGLYDRDGEIALTAILLSRGVLEAGTTRGPTTIKSSTSEKDALLRSGMEFRRRMGEVLSEICPRVLSTGTQKVMYIDYAPWVRQMVEAEDMQEAAHKENRGRLGRMTRNSGGYVRTIILSEEGRAGLTATGLDGVVGRGG